MILVAGGGLAGAAAATALARGGRAVSLIEREVGPREKICGEFLSAEAQESLAALGLDLAPLRGHRITHVRLIRGARAVTTRLPFDGLGVSRKILDAALLDHAAAAGVVVHRGETVRSIACDPHLSVATEGLGMLRPEALLLATGKHEARGTARDAKASNFVGFKNYFELAPAHTHALAGHVELYLFQGGYAGLQLVEGGRANFCALADAAWLRRAGGKFPVLLEMMRSESKVLAARLDNAVPELGAPLTIARVPYGFVHRPAAGDCERLYRLGDQAAVIHSFTGDGMAIALHSAALAARMLLEGAPARAYHARLAANVAGQVSRAGALHRLLSAPYIGAALFAGARLAPRAVRLSAALTRVPPQVRLAH
jgi:flavin-dependent dehydrogenase